MFDIGAVAGGCHDNSFQRVKNMASDSGLTKIAKYALLCFACTCLIVTIAFSTNAWLETDGTLENPKFVQLGKLVLLASIVRPRLDCCGV